jgi:small subunit ribosomal protein S1
LVHVSEISREKIERPSDLLKANDTVTAVVLHVDSSERRIGLSMKALKEKTERADVEKYISDQEFKASNLGELIQEKMERRDEESTSREEEE